MPAKGWRKPKEEKRAGAVIVVSRSCIACTADPDRELIGYLRDFARQGRSSSVLRKVPYTRNKELMGLLTRIVRQGLHKRKGVRKVAEETAVRLARLPERIAAIVGKTYVVKGDGAELSDDEALGMICDLLNEVDESLIPTNKDKRLARTSLR